MFHPVLLRRHMMLCREQAVEVRAVRKAKHRYDFGDGSVCLQKVVFRFVKAECHSVFEQSHSSIFLGNAVQIIAAVIQKCRKFMS